MGESLVCEEMTKLREYLDSHKISWEDRSEEIKKDGATLWWMCRTKFKIGKKHFSVINGYGSYGGYNLYNNTNSGLLELLIKGEPEGFLTAEDIIKKIEAI